MSYTINEKGELVGQDWLGKMWSGTGDAATKALTNVYDNALASGMTTEQASNLAQSAYDKLGADSFSDKGLAGMLNPSGSSNTILGLDKGTWGNLSSAVGLAGSLLGYFSGKDKDKAMISALEEQSKGLKQARLMDQEKWNTFKADKARLNQEYTKSV